MKDEILKVIEFSKKSIQDVEILFIANVYGKTEMRDYEANKDSIITEFFTESEYNSLLKAIKSAGFSIKTFFNEEEFIKYVLDNDLRDCTDKVAFNLARNGKGLDKKALIPAFCLSRGIMFTGPGAYTTGLGRNKYHYNRILSSVGIPAAESFVYTKGGWLLDKKPEIGQHIIAKPMYESASRGVHSEGIFIYDDSKEQHKYLANLQNSFEQDIVVQEFLEGDEFEVPIVELSRFKALGVTKIVFEETINNPDRIIDYNTAFDETYKFEVVENPTLRKLAEEAAQVLGLQTYARIDFRSNGLGDYKVIDISTHPYIIEHSSYRYVFESLGFKHSDIFSFIIGKTLLNKKD